MAEMREEEIELRRALEDMIYALRTLRNNVNANTHYPEALVNARELELLLKGIVLEIAENG